MAVSLPRILSPNLGCPQILSIEELNTKGFPLVIAEDSPSTDALSVFADPSFRGEGTGFKLYLTDGEELSDGSLPATFGDVEETRFLISTTLKTIMGGKAKFFRYQAKPSFNVGPDAYRQAKGKERGTLYNLCLSKSGTQEEKVHHALYLRPDKEELKFIFSDAEVMKTTSEGICFFNSTERSTSGVGDKEDAELILPLTDWGSIISERLGILKLADGVREAISAV